MLIISLLNKSSKNFKLKLLFRGSEHQFSSETFHKLCDYKGRTLSIVKSEFGKIFGLYTNIPWSSEGNQKTGQGSTFKFTLRDMQVETFPVQKGKTEVLHSRLSMIATTNFAIKDQCNLKTTLNNAHVGMGFDIPAHLEDKQLSDQMTYLGGAKNFAVTEIEVF